MNIAAAVIPFRGAIKTFQAATSPAAICCVLRLDTIGIFRLCPITNWKWKIPRNYPNRPFYPKQKLLKLIFLRDIKAFIYLNLFAQGWNSYYGKQKFAYEMTYPDAFSIILPYNLYISIVVQSKLQTDHFVEIRQKRNNSHNKENI